MGEREPGRFRGELFGGFKRSDVVEYLRQASENYEKCRAENERLRQELAGRDSGEAELRSRLAECERKLEDANAASALFEEEYGKSEARAEAMRSEGEALRGQVAELSRTAESYEKTKGRLAELELSACRRATDIERGAAEASQAALDGFIAELSRLRGEFDRAQYDIKVAAAHISQELEHISARVSSVLDMVDEAGGRLTTVEGGARAYKDKMNGGTENE